MDITKTIITTYSKKFNSKKSNIITRNALTNTNLDDIVLNRDIVQNINPTFYKKIDIESDITNQEMSGRCWIFSFLNVIRLHMIKKYQLNEDFEFSQNYLLFWDKLEKANMFLDNIIKTRDKDINSRLCCLLLQDPIQDGGQWNMVLNLVNKYGLIPKDVMRETYHSGNTDKMNKLLRTKLIHFAHSIRNLNDTEFKNIKKIVSNMLYQIYTILVIFLGEPPTNFIWKYYKQPGDNCKKCTKKQKKTYKMTPLHFYKVLVPYKANDKLVLINAPIKSKPFYNIYNIEYFNNMVNGVPTSFINVPIKILIESAKKSIDNKEAVWFGCDVSKYSNNEYGIFDDKIYDFKAILDFDIELSKGNDIEYFQNIMNHAMILKGYDVDNKKNITKWLVENSWGEDIGMKGEYIMSNNWFKKYVYQIVIDKKYVDKTVLEILGKEPVICPLWDPFGSLAIR